MVEATKEMGIAFSSIPQSCVVDADLKRKMERIGAIHRQISELKHEELEEMFFYVDIHVRVIGSIKVAYLIRNRMFERVIALEAYLLKKRGELIKHVEAKRSDKILLLKKDVARVELDVEEASRTLHRSSDLLVQELARGAIGRVKEFEEVLDKFVVKLRERQKEVFAPLTLN